MRKQFLFLTLFSLFFLLLSVNVASAVISEYELGKSPLLSQVVCGGGQPNNDGTLLFYQSCSSDTILLLNLSNNYNISSNRTIATTFVKQDIFNLTISGDFYTPIKQPQRFSKDGLNIYFVMRNTTGEDLRIVQYKLTSAWNLSTATSYAQIQVDNTASDRFSISNVHSSFPNNIDISDNGRIVVLSLLTWNDFNQTEGHRNTSIIFPFTLNTPFDLSTSVANYSGIIEGVRQVNTGDVGNSTISRSTENLFNFTQLSVISFAKQDSISFYNSGSTAFIVSHNVSNTILKQYDLSSPYGLTTLFGGTINLTSIGTSGYSRDNLIIFNDTEFNALGYISSATNELSERNLTLGKPLVVLAQSNGSSSGNNATNTTNPLLNNVNKILGIYPDSDTITIRQKWTFVFITMFFIAGFILITLTFLKLQSFTLPLIIILILEVMAFFFFISIGYVSTGVLIILILALITATYFKLSGNK